MELIEKNRRNSLALAMKRVDLFASSSELDEAESEDFAVDIRRKNVKNIASLCETIIDETDPSLAEKELEPTAKSMQTFESSNDELDRHIFLLENPPSDFKDLIDNAMLENGFDVSDKAIPEPYKLYFRWRLENQIASDETWWPRNPIILTDQVTIIPPPLPPFSEELATTCSSAVHVQLMVSFENELRKLTRYRTAIGNLMVFVLDHQRCAEELIDSIARSIMSDQATFEQIVSRVYLLSDILHNSSSSRQEHAKIRSLYQLAAFTLINLIE